MYLEQHIVVSFNVVTVKQGFMLLPNSNHGSRISEKDLDVNFNLLLLLSHE